MTQHKLRYNHCKINVLEFSNHATHTHTTGISQRHSFPERQGGGHSSFVSGPSKRRSAMSILVSWSGFPCCANPKLVKTISHTLQKKWCFIMPLTLSYCASDSARINQFNETLGTVPRPPQGSRSPPAPVLGSRSLPVPVLRSRSFLVPVLGSLSFKVPVLGSRSLPVPVLGSPSVRTQLGGV